MYVSQLCTSKENNWI